LKDFSFKVGDMVYLCENDEQLAGEVIEIFTNVHGEQVSLVLKNKAIGSSNFIVIDLSKIVSAEKIRSH
jgi:hypothetical protein